MRLLRSIWKDIVRLSGLPRVVKIGGLVIGVLLILAAWHAGAEWWTRPRIFVTKGIAREVAPLEEAIAIFAIVFVVYAVYALGRDLD